MWYVINGIFWINYFLKHIFHKNKYFYDFFSRLFKFFLEMDFWKFYFIKVFWKKKE